MDELFTIDAGQYKVLRGDGIFDHLTGFLSGRSYSKMFLLVDENTQKHCMPELVSRVEALQDAEILEIESGEENKSIEVCVQLWTALSELGADRKSLVVNLGGGVIGDMGGFVASTFKRGIDFVNIPTTLLAQVDASVGGKLGIDLGNLKNEIGVFNSPQAVYIYPGFLRTLDERQLRSGFAEMIKHALIADAKYWKQVMAIDHTDVDELELLIPSSIEIKNKIVLSDPYEKNERKALNFGHTIGHALESLSLGSESQLLHGEAVAAGMICEAFLSHKVAGLSEAALNEITGYVLNVFGDVLLPADKDEELISLMHHDKKNEQGRINFTLLEAIGKHSINRYCDEDQIKEAWTLTRKTFGRL